MALPAGRRGIRANLVKSDGSIDNSSIEDDISELEEMIDADHLALTALSSRLDTNIVKTASLEAALNAINSESEPLFKYKEYRYDYTNLPANGDLTVTATQLNFERPEGYTPISTNMYITDKASVLVRYINVSAQESSNVVALHNIASTAQSGYFRMRVIFVRTNLLKGF